MIQELIKAGDIDKIKILVAQNKDIISANNCTYEITGAEGETKVWCSPLLYALMLQKDEVILFLMKNGADIHQEELWANNDGLRCPIALGELKDHQIIRLPGTGQIHTDKLYDKTALVNAVKIMQKHPMTRMPITLPETLLLPLYYSPLSLACRLKSVESIDRMELDENDLAVVARYALVCKCDILMGLLEKKLKAISKTFIDIVPMITKNHITAYAIAFYQPDPMLKMELLMGESRNFQLISSLKANLAELTRFWIEKKQCQLPLEHLPEIVTMLLDSRSYSAINILLEGIDVNLTLQTQILEHLPQIDEGIPVLEHLSWMLENDLFEIFKLFLEHNDIQFEPKQDEKEYNFLRLSVKKPKYLQLMLEKGANPNHISGESNPLFEAIREKNLTSVRFLLHFGAIVNYENDEGVNALAIAIVQNSIDIFQELMMRDGIDVTLGRQTIHYPLYCAFKRKDIESAKLLSSHFEQDKVYNFWLPKEKKWQKFSLLSFAEILNFSKFIEWWVNEGANINFVSIESPRTLLETMLHREDFAKNSKNIKLVKSLGGCVLEDGYQNKISNIAAALSSKPAFSKVVTALKAKVTCFKSKDNFFDAFLYPALSVEKCAALESCHIYNDQVEVRSYFSKKTYTRIFNINCPNLYGHMEEFASKY